MAQTGPPGSAVAYGKVIGGGQLCLSLTKNKLVNLYIGRRLMNVIDCESRLSALKSIANLYAVSPSELDDFLGTFDLDAHYTSANSGRYSDQELRVVFESTFSRESNPIDRVYWFHLTRARQVVDFENGIYPLTSSLERVWQTILDVFLGTDHEVRLRQMRENGVPNRQYELKVGVPLHSGPYAMLVRDVAICPSKIGNHDYLALPEIMDNICTGYQDAYGESIHDVLKNALVPIVVKFWSAKKIGLNCIESALYYLYLTAHDRQLNVNANTCFDGGNQAIPPSQIINVELLFTENFGKC